MAQGIVKKSNAAPKKTRPALPQRGTRVIKPKKAALIKQQQIKKKTSSGLTAMTEKALAEKAGHLEMLKGGKKERDDKAKAKALKHGTSRK
ncbi:hypothetical protein MBLNU459_g4303t1 [Dothideomycetes sp. NU459]